MLSSSATLPIKDMDYLPRTALLVETSWRLTLPSFLVHDERM